MKKSLLILILFLFTATSYAAPDWSTLTRLINEQKSTQTLLEIDRILKKAKHEKDNKTWQQALIFGATAKSKSGGYEKGVNYLNQPWPQDNESRILINLHKAYLLNAYIQAYRWEIQKREKIASRKAIPLKKKTMKQLLSDVNQAFSIAYTLAKKQATDAPLSQFSLPFPKLNSYFIKPNYPAQVRGNIRDTIVYLWVDFLQDRSLWSPSESSQANSLSLQKLLAISFRDKFGYSSKVNPLKRQLWLLSDLENYERSQKKPEAAMEAFRVKIEKLSETRNSPEELKLLINALKQSIAHNRQDLPWINMLRNTQAKLLRQTNSDDAKIKSVAVLKQCLAQHKKENATAHCQDQMNALTKPSFQLTAMKVDGLKKRSILITHRNINKVYFRAWQVNFQQALQGREYDLVRAFLAKNGRKPDAQWQSNIQDKKDYNLHKTFVTPPINQYGYWVIAASNSADFSVAKDAKNIVLSTMLNLTRLVADVKIGGTNKKENNLNITVYNGETGHVASKVKAEIWLTNYNTPPKLLASALTSPNGKVAFNIHKEQQYTLVLRLEKDTSITQNIYPYTNNYRGHFSKRSLIFTDRAIYRPSQKIQWKVVAYQGDTNTGKFNVIANNTGWVKLFDANGKLVQQKSVKTNPYGSASGEFIAKAGRLLGSWRIETSWSGRQYLKVEEYKRPTFTVKIKGSKNQLALNKPARIEGFAKYYFGQSITDGKVKWRVTRNEVPLWNYGGRGILKQETIATGVSKVNASGNFIINFLPRSARPKQLTSTKKDINQYYFTVTADFTDSGGETRSASKSIRVSKVGVEASIYSAQSFGIAGKPFELNITRKDTNGAPSEGSAYWELYQIAQPGQAQMPADTPVSIKPVSRFASKGDSMNPRWTSMSTVALNIDSNIKNWKDRQKVRRGTLQHNKSGDALIKLKGLGAGLYRLRYTTKDQWGQPYKTDKTFVIAFKDKTTIRLPAVLEMQKSLANVGEKISYIAGSGFIQSPVVVEVYHGNKLLRRSIQTGGIKQLDFPVSQEHQGGLTFVLSMVKDYQLLRKTSFVTVPWADSTLDVSFTTFRDKLEPGQKEKWRISVKDSKKKPMAKGSVELLASMYDRSLDFFANHSPQSVTSLYQQKFLTFSWKTNIGLSRQLYGKYYNVNRLAKFYQSAQLRLLPSANGNGVMYDYAGGFALKKRYAAPRAARRAAPVAPAPSVNVVALQEKKKAYAESDSESNAQISANSNQLGTVKVRKNFSETAFFYPHLLLEEDGTVAFEFEVPESLTEWKVWVSAITKDLRGGTAIKLATSSKELMVRPYLPRFLRAGDHAYIEVLVNNMSDKALAGKLDFDILDASTLKSISANFKLANKVRNFNVASGKSSRLRFSIVAPKELGMVAIRARASAGKLGDGEQKPIPILPSRIHLSQSRFAALQGNMSKTLQFKQLAQNNDPTRINDKLVVTVDGQLFYSTLNALPYLVKYPYECTEQTMNRFLSTSIINSVFKSHPAIASMAKKLAKRDTQYEKWEQVDKDPNRKMLLEETPWLNDAKGGKQSMADLIRILDPKIANVQSQKALLKLRKAQKPSGGFPWWDGGRESVYMTAYLLHGFSRALEFKVNVPKDMVQRAWRYLDKEYKSYYKDNRKLKANLYQITLTNYVLSSYPDVSWTRGAFNNNDRKVMLDLSFKNWRRLPGLLKAYLALTLKRAGRVQDAQLVFDSIMDSAKTDQELGTYWAPEDRSWLWYNDRVDTHAFMLRAMMELNPTDKRRHGLVQWLMLNKKLNHWKSTRATAESIYSLVHYLKKENQLGLEERALIKIGNLLDKTVVFKPTEYTGKAQLVVEGNDIKPSMATISVNNQGKSLMFASATWHFSTERLPKSAQGDFFNVNRRFFKRVQRNKQWVLEPLQEGAQIKIGDQLEIQLSLRAKHAAEFVHLRAPRGAGFEPVSQTSGYRWDTGISYFEEIRDSGANYFFEWLPAGEYAFKYRLRATTAGEFRVAPATVQSIYAPEFNAYSSGKRLVIR